jgi:hypothetical protein
VALHGKFMVNQLQVLSTKQIFGLEHTTQLLYMYMADQVCLETPSHCTAHKQLQYRCMGCMAPNMQCRCHYLLLLLHTPPLAITHSPSCLAIQPPKLAILKQRMKSNCSGATL